MAGKDKNKILKYFLSLSYPMDLEKDPEEGIFVIRFPDLPGCIAHGKTPTSVYKDAQEAKKTWIETALELGRNIPKPKPEEEYSGTLSVRLFSRDLHRRLALQAKKKGRSLNQHINILLSEGSRTMDLNRSADRFEFLLDRFERDMVKQRKTHSSTVRTASKKKERQIPYGEAGSTTADESTSSKTTVH